MCAFNLLDPLMTNRVTKQLCTSNYNKWGSPWEEIRTFPGEYLGVNKETVLMTGNFGITLDVIFKYFRDETKRGVVYMPPNLGKETVDSGMRVFGADYLTFYDFKKDLSYKLPKIVAEDGVQNFFVYGTFYGIPIHVSEDYLNELRENGVKIGRAHV